MLVMLPLQICSDHQMGYINSMKGVPPCLLPGKCCDMCERWLNHRTPRISFHTGPQSVRFWLCARARIYMCTVKWAKCSYTLLRHVVRIKKADGLAAKGWTDPWFSIASSKWQWGVLLLTLEQNVSFLVSLFWSSYSVPTCNTLPRPLRLHSRKCLFVW